MNIDYHIQVEGRFYSVPHALARQEVEIRLGISTRYYRVFRLIDELALARAEGS